MPKNITQEFGIEKRKKTVTRASSAYTSTIPRRINTLRIMENLITRLVSVTDLSRGMVTKVIGDVAKNKKPYIVLKNNKPQAAIVAIEEFNKLLAAQEELYLLKIAEERITNTDYSKSLSHTQVLEKYNITESEVDAAVDKIEFE